MGDQMDNMKNKTFRSLENYKTQQADVAKDRGVYEQLMKAKSLTEARKIMYGSKQSKHGR